MIEKADSMKKESWNESLWFDAALILLQHLLMFGAFYFFLDLPLPKLVLIRDGIEYLEVALAIKTWSFEDVYPANRQYFIGYPMVLGTFLLVFKPWVAVYVIHFFSAIGMVWVLRKLLGNIWIPRYFALVFPTYVMTTILVASEPLFLFLIFTSLYLWLSKKVNLACILLGLLTLVRPQAAFFLCVPLFLMALYHKKWREVGALVLFTGLGLIALFSFNGYAWGEPLANFIAYNQAAEGGMMRPPFQNLIYATLSDDFSVWKKFYVWTHVLLVIVGLSLLAFKLKKGEASELEKICFIWAFLHTLFYVSVGSWWGFHSLHRYLLPALPIALICLARWIPKSYSLLILFSIISGGLVVLSEVYH